MFLLIMIIVAFVLGALTILALEAVGAVILVRWLNQKVQKEEEKANSASSSSSAAAADIDPPFYNRQGFIWVLESEKVPQGWPLEKVTRGQRPKKDILEVTPARKYAKIKDHCLILMGLDGSHTKFSLKGCIIEAVSATGLSSRKWAKRFPIKVEKKESEIYKGCKAIYVYLETSWEKESWCKALRLASCDDKEKIKWFAKLNMEYRNYLTSLNAEYPSFMKPSLGISANPVDKSIKIDGSSSKVRQFLKKLAKKASKGGLEVKASSTLIPSRDERKQTDKSYSFEDATWLEKKFPAASTPYPSAESSKSSSSSSISATSSSRSQLSVISDRDPEDTIFADEGTLCWNLLISRLFFDAKSNMQMKTALKSRIQRTLSNMRTPSYIGEIICTSADTGNLPPYIHGMRVLPSDMNEVWAMEIDIEYAGGAVLEIETRLEVKELDSQEGEGATIESSSVGEITSDLLEGIEYLGEQLNVSEDTVEEMDQKDERDSKPDDNRSCKITTRTSSQGSRWRSILHSVAKQVSQVPLSLGIKVASLRGIARLYIKPPPSDQIWFGFTSMPDVDFNLESHVGEHKVASGHLALFLISRFKAAIRESLVLPNCESVYIPWMLAEKDDWVPRNVAPFIWINQDGAANTTPNQEAPSSNPRNLASSDESREAPSGCQVNKNDGSGSVGCSTQPTSESSEPNASSAPTTNSTADDHSLQDLRTPLLKNDEAPPENFPRNSEGTRECHLQSQSLISSDEVSHSGEDDELRPKRFGARARMLGLGKKMGEKLEEKRRHLEEKGRIIVEKMKEHRN